MTESLEHKVYYINEVSLTKKEMKQCADKVTAVIEVIFNIDEKNMIVSNLFSNKKGCGSALMVFACKEGIKKGITDIILDDCSIRYNQKNNLYVKMGMKYVSVGDGPEMVGKTNKISKYCVHNKEIKEIKL